LKRFDLDYNTFERVKLNDVVKFPPILNLNPFVTEGDTTQFYFASPPSLPASSESSASLKPEDYHTRCLVEVEPSFAPILPDSERLEEVYPSQLDALKQQRLQEVVRESKAGGEHVYELYAVLVHSGSAFSGHYYAYIKDFESCQWSEFNDSVVRRISYDKVVKAFGKAEEAQATNATNAYMLMYRKVVDSGLKSVAQSSIPSYLQDMIAQQQAEEDLRTAELIDKLSNLTIHVYLNTSYKDIAI
jgi:ubiquitin carboxyl-terminal hydrolase 47